MTDALSSLYGQGHVDATRTRECVAMPGLREQTVFTPWEIVAILLALWGRVAYDPCHGHPGVVLTASGRKLARGRKLAGLMDDGWTHEALVAEKHAVAVQSVIPAERRTDSRGLEDPWVDATFCNPPYGTLREWLEYSMRQPVDHVLLVPVRPHRKWWREWANTVELVYLNPLRFLGHDQAAPFPLCLARANTPDGEVGKLAHLCVSAGLGSPITGRQRS